MNKNDNLIPIIDAYLKRHLSQTETEAFEQGIAADPALAKQVAQQKGHLEALEILVADDLTAQMQAWETEIETKKGNFGNGKLWLWGLFTIALLAAFYVLLKPKKEPKKEPITPSFQDTNRKDTLNMGKQDAPKQVVDTIESKAIPLKIDTKSIKKQHNLHLKQQTPIANNTDWIKELLNDSKTDLVAVVSEIEKETTRRGDKSDILISQIDSFIQAKDYDRAINLLKNMPDTEGGYLLAIAYFLKGEYDKAQPLFDKFSSNKGFYQAETAEYYAAISVLSLGNKEDARQRFTKIADDIGHLFYEKAKITLKQLGYLKGY